MKSKLNKHRGFTIAEIIIAVAIMATLIAVLMNGLKASRANIKRDTYQAELIKRAMTVGAKVEAYVFEHGGTAGFAPTNTDREDPVGQLYAIVAADPTTAGDPYTVTVAPQANGILSLLGVQPHTYSFH